MAKSSRARFPPEIFAMIMVSCEQHDLLCLAKASRALYMLALPLLYQEVDISTHNRPPVPDPAFTDGRLVFADQRPLQPTPARMIVRQHSFLTALVNHPEHGHFVERFSWTLIFTGDIGKSCPDEPPEILTAPIELSIWDVFQKLTHVRYLDFASLQTFYIPYVAEHPRTLFPSATSVRLLGVMPRSLPRCILNSINPSELTHLGIDDLQDWGLAENGLPMTADEGYTLGNNRHETNNADGTPRTVFPGPMHGILLQSSVRHCTTLRSLLLRKAGQRDGNTADFSRSSDEKVYEEWEGFLALENIQATLETLVVEQGVIQKHFSAPARAPPLIAQ